MTANAAARETPAWVNDPETPELPLFVLMRDALQPWLTTPRHQSAIVAATRVARVYQIRAEQPLVAKLREAYEDRNATAAALVKAGERAARAEHAAEHLSHRLTYERTLNAALSKLVEEAHRRPLWRRWMAWAGF